MRTDLGTWHGPQADAVVRVLRRAGLSPRTEKDREGTRITVPAAENDQAHQVLAGAMEDIARAAARASRADETQRGGTNDPGRPTASEGSPLVTERLRNAAPITGLVVALVVAAMIPPGVIRTSAFVLALVGFGIVWARRNPDR